MKCPKEYEWILTFAQRLQTTVSDRISGEGRKQIEDG
jgi:hypothetical protein